MAENHQGDPQPRTTARDHNRALDPGFEEDPDIFMELGEGVFYQASYDGTEVDIIADYPGLLPVSHVSNQETYPSKEFPLSALPRTILCSKGKAIGAPRCT